MLSGTVPYDYIAVQYSLWHFTSCKTKTSCPSNGNSLHKPKVTTFTLLLCRLWQLQVLTHAQSVVRQELSREWHFFLQNVPAGFSVLHEIPSFCIVFFKQLSKLTVTARIYSFGAVLPCMRTGISRWHSSDIPYHGASLRSQFYIDSSYLLRCTL